jgi:TolB protein
MMRQVFRALLAVALGGTGLACPNYAAVQCQTDPNCNLTTGGVCAVAGTGNHWCAYPDGACPSGFRFSDRDVGDGLAGSCVASLDAGIDAPVDAPIDTKPDAAIDGDTSPRCRVAFEDGIRGSFPGDGSREVWIANTDGTGFVNVSNNPADDFGPSWAPNGLRIAFASNRRGLETQHRDRYDIFVVNIDGTGLANLTEGSFSSTAPVWSPDGTRIAFTRSGKLWVMNADGSGAVQVSTLTPIDFWVWSPQSDKIAFDHFEMQGLIVPTIVVATVGDGSTPVRLTSSNGPERSASWNPAARIVFTASTGDIFTANADGTNPVNVTMNSSDLNSDPKWADAGNTIVFAKRVTGHSEIWVISSSGGPARQLTNNDVGHDFPQDVSPQGLVAYNHQISIDAGQVGIIDINGNGERHFNAPGGTNSRAARFSPCQ